MKEKCEFHDEAFNFIRDGLKEINNKLGDGYDKFTDLEKKKLGWGAFTWIVGILIFIWAAIQGTIYLDIKTMGRQIVEMDKKIAVYLKNTGGN